MRSTASSISKSNSNLHQNSSSSNINGSSYSLAPLSTPPQQQQQQLQQQQHSEAAEARRRKKRAPKVNNIISHKNIRFFLKKYFFQALNASLEIWQIQRELKRGEMVQVRKTLFLNFREKYFSGGVGICQREIITLPPPPHFHFQMASQVKEGRSFFLLRHHVTKSLKREKISENFAHPGFPWR